MVSAHPAEGERYYLRVPLNLLGSHSPAINECIGFSLACRQAAPACKFIRPARHTAHSTLPHAHAVFSSRQTAQACKPIKLLLAKLQTHEPNCAGMHANFFGQNFNGQKSKLHISNLGATP
jgi:hypothetical protein